MGSGDRDDMARNRGMKHVSGVSAIREVDYLPVAVGYLHLWLLDIRDGVIWQRAYWISGGRT